jgi:hypothetical protein
VWAFVLLAALPLVPLGHAAPKAARAAGAGAVPVASDRIAPPVGIRLAPLSPDRSLALAVALVPRDAAGLAALDAGLAARPGSGFLTEPQFEARFAPPAANASAVAAYFARFGAHDFRVSSDRLGLTFVMDAGNAARALRVSWVAFGRASADAPLYTSAGAPRLPPAVAARVSGVGGLSDWADPFLAWNAHRVAPPRSVAALRTGPAQFVRDASSGQLWYLGSDYAQAYGESALFPGGGAGSPGVFPSREAVATLLLSGYNATSDADLPPWDPAVVLGYYNDTFPAGWPHPNVTGVPVPFAGRTPPRPGSFGTQSDDTQNEAENSLDLEMAGSLAPGARLANFYIAGSLDASPSSNATVSDLADGFATALGAALAYNYTPQRLVAVSNSFGLPDLNDPLWNSELAHAAATGVTIVAASGDQGDAPDRLTGRFQGPWPTWPGSAAGAASGAVSVGGASVALAGAPTGTFTGGNLSDPYDSSVRGISNQSVWWDPVGGPGNFSGSEGGASLVYAEPAWQLRSAAQPSIVNATVTQGFGRLARSEPDLAFAANTTIAYVSANASGTFFEVLEGTSIAAPLFAGIVAEWAATLGAPLGFLDPALYRMASYFAAHPSNATPFADVATGANYAFGAGPGWDAATGWGGLRADAFVSAYGNATIRGYVYTGPTPGLPPPGTTNKTSPPPVSGLLLLAIFVVAVVVAILIAYAIWRANRRVQPPPYSAVPAPAYSVPPGAYAPGPGSPPAWAPAPWSPPPAPLPSSPAAGPGQRVCPTCGQYRPEGPYYCPQCGAPP